MTRRTLKGSSVQLGLYPEPPASGAIGAIEAWAEAICPGPLLGVDEAGRGPLAGPVYAAAVALPPGPLPPSLKKLNDSKCLSASVRQQLACAIPRYALAIGVARVDAGRVDEINILEATREAMHAAVETARRRLKLLEAPLLLVDGNLRLPGYVGVQHALVKGDGRSWNIAAASVMAKVARDRWMTVLDRRFPGYDLARHKGYGTKAHRAALVALGPSPIHRRSFRWKAP